MDVSLSVKQEKPRSGQFIPENWLCLAKLLLAMRVAVFSGTGHRL
jgi:hypothetical protein